MKSIKILCILFVKQEQIIQMIISIMIANKPYNFIANKLWIAYKNAIVV